MQRQLNFTGNMCYLYLTKTIIQLLKVIPEKSSFLFTIKNKTLYITKYDESSKGIENPFVRKMRKVGNGYGIFFTKTMLELIDINPNKDEADISIEDNTLVIKKALNSMNENV